MSAPLRPAWLAGQPVSRRKLRRLRRRLESVGVDVPADRLRRIAAGDPPTAAELVDITFADLATSLRGDQRHRKRVRAQRYCLHSAVVIGATVVALNLLVCLGLLFFTLAAHGFPH
jgi:hypothetical protein